MKKGKCREGGTENRKTAESKVNLERKIGSLNSESNLVISLTTGPAEGQRGRGQVPGVHLPQQKYRHGAWLTGKLENLKWDAHSQSVCCSLLSLSSVTVKEQVSDTQGGGR